MKTSDRMISGFTDELQTNSYNSDKESENGNRGRRTPQYLAALAASIAAFTSGNVIGWMAQISSRLLNGELGFPINEDELGWVGSFMPFGAAMLTLAVGSICDLIGRKNTMLLLIILISSGWSLIIWAQSVSMVYGGRFVTGMVAGSYCVTVPLYTNEIAQKEIRGALGCFTQLMLSFGILFDTIVGKYLSITNLTITVAIFPLIFGMVFIFMPETPVYLLRKGRDEEARQSLRRLRGDSFDIESEIKEIRLTFKYEQKFNIFETLRESLRHKAARRASVIGLGLMTFKILSGIDAITSYMTLIYEATDMDLDPQTGTIIFAAIQTASAFGQSLVVDKLGRRILLIISDGTMTICLVLVGVVLALKKNDLIPEDQATYVNYIPLIALCVFTVAFSLGLGPIPFVMCAEVFPEEIRSFATSVCNTLKWVLAILSLKCFIEIQTTWGIDVCFFIFAVLSFIGTLFIVFVVPETKEKSFMEIQEMLEK